MCKMQQSTRTPSWLDEIYRVTQSRTHIKCVIDFNKISTFDCCVSSNFSSLREVVLRGEFVSEAGPKETIANTIPNVTDLDVSKCLLGSWRTVADITSQLKYMKTLNVSDNRLSVPERPAELKTAFAQLKTLFLNRSSYDWHQVRFNFFVFILLHYSAYPIINTQDNWYHHFVNQHTSSISLNVPHPVFDSLGANL